jgi:hypothetical protein
VLLLLPLPFFAIFRTLYSLENGFDVAVCAKIDKSFAHRVEHNKNEFFPATKYITRRVVEKCERDFF